MYLFHAKYETRKMIANVTKCVLLITYYTGSRSEAQNDLRFQSICYEVSI